MKVCRVCDIEKPEYDFPGRWRNDEVGPRDSKCRVCTENSNKAWRLANPEQVRRNNRVNGQKRVTVKRAIAELARNKPCADCDRTFPLICMDFDHVRGVKVNGVAQMISGFQYTTDDIKAEIAKCEVVCSNCHRIRTTNNGWGRKHMNREQQSAALKTQS